MVIDILVKTDNPDRLDDTVNNFGGAVVGRGVAGGYKMVDDCYVVRCFGDVGLVKFAIQNQGCGEFIREV